MYIYKLDSNWNRLHGDLDIGDLTAHGTRLGLSDEANLLNKKPNYYVVINNPLTVPTGGVFFGGNLGGSSPSWGASYKVYIDGLYIRTNTGFVADGTIIVGTYGSGGTGSALYCNAYHQICQGTSL